MANKVKGCLTAGCKANTKKIKYKKDDLFCTKCGCSLVEVCKKCYGKLPEGYKKSICERCIAERNDKRDRNIKNAGKGAGVAAGVGVVAAAAVKKGPQAVKAIAKVVFKA